MQGLSITDTKIIYKFPFDKQKIELCKNIGMRWAPAKKHWQMDRSLMNEKLFHMTFGNNEQPHHLESVPMNPDYKPHPMMMRHQLDGIRLAAERSRHLFAFDTGTGKTFQSIEIIKQKGLKTLVVCPLSIIVPAWIEDILKFAPELSFVNLWALWKKQKTLDFKTSVKKDFNIGIINYESFRTTHEHLKDAGFQMLICDESSFLKSYKAQVTKLITDFADNVEYCYLLSGMPAPNNDMEYFSQVRIIDPAVFGKSFYRFRNKYFYSAGYGGYTWLPQSNKRTEFLNALSKTVSVVKKEDVLDLPERTDNIREVTLTSKEMKAYNDMAVHLVAEIEDSEITAYNAAVKLMKLRQVTAGFMFDEDKRIIQIGKSKLVELTSLLNEIGNNQVLIWTQFQEEGRQLFKLLNVEKDGRSGTGLCGLCDGTVPQFQKEEYVKQFIAGDIQYLIAHPRSLGHGVTLVNASYAVYYSLSYSLEEHYQSRDRIYRKGQVNKCTYYYLLAEKSIDKIIYNALKGKLKAEKAVMQYIMGKHKISKDWGDFE